MARAEIAEDVLNIVRNDILDVPCPGQVQENPASSCLEVSQCNPQLPSKYYWLAIVPWFFTAVYDSFCFLFVDFSSV